MTEYSIVKLNHLGKEIEIKVTNFDMYTFNYPIPRPLPESNSLYGSGYTMNISQQEFYDDLKLMLPDSFIGDIRTLGLEPLIQRILPNDIDAYIGLNILLYDNINFALNKKRFEKNEKESIFIQSFQLLHEFIPQMIKDLA
jgi:hypothetical protein